MTTVAAGWIGWSERQTLDTDVNYIMQAYQGRMDMLKAIFGDGDNPSPTPRPSGPPKGADGKPIVLTPAAFDVTFDTQETHRQIRIKTKTNA